MSRHEDPPRSTLRDFYDAQYREGPEALRTSKLYTLACVPDRGRLSVLDIGCGTGENSAVIAAKGHAVCGIDISSTAIAAYGRRGFDGRVMDAERRLDFADDMFDLVFCSEVIEHLATPEVLLRESLRVLRPGGRLVVSTPNSAFWLYRLLGLLGRTVAELQHPRHVQFFSRRSLRRLLRQAGFEPVEDLGRNMYLVLPPLPPPLSSLAARAGLHREARFRTKSHFWHLSSRSRVWNSLLADTLICVMRKPARPS
jgi:SAM-dependent methyltransferase